MTMPAIRVRAVTKNYGALTALAGVDLEIESSFSACSALNGAGKTTLISALAGLVRQTVVQFDCITTSS